MFIMQCLQTNGELNFWLYLPNAKRRTCNAGWILGLFTCLFLEERIFNYFKDLRSAFSILVFQGMLEIFWKYLSNHIIWVPKKIHRYWIQFSSFLGTALFLKEIFVTISGNWNDPDWTVTFCPVTHFLLVHVWLYKLQKRINLPIGCFTAVTSCVVSLFLFFFFLFPPVCVATPPLGNKTKVMPGPSPIRVKDKHSYKLQWKQS